MTVVFQERIIYMPYMPPGARSEKIDDYAAVCLPVVWQEERIRSGDGTKISLCVGRLHLEERIPPHRHEEDEGLVICYFQGNGSSSPPRLPLLSHVLKLLDARAPNVRCTIVALSYRGYWTSSGRATQQGIELDAEAMLKWVAERYSRSQLILWGQSIGAGIASTAAARCIQSKSYSKPLVTGLLLETPFTSIKSMLLALYPQSWLPYRYLGPFLRSHWDSETALRSIAAASLNASEISILLMPATRDEVVPPQEVEKLEDLCKELRLRYMRKDILGALHTEATTRRDGQKAVVDFVLKVREKLSE
ncbi:hypothetical protein LTR62_003103 [Meristemomyces frigidus]|uniref:AB hydrolase-1 domain-containing protein n=1 Tax=Meristemomyces frigidus TaxID=1508187 RepID=A0AAN7YH86_9PEZI|nr:hypothetical protein LTR62_003103 [Meristemomyces frigidus]